MDVTKTKTRKLLVPIGSLVLSALSSCALDMPASSISVKIPDMRTSTSLETHGQSLSFQQGSNAFTMPSTYTGFTCFGVLVSGPDMCWITGGNQNSNNRGPIFGGLVDQSGGSIRLQVPTGSYRKVQLFGVMSNATAPACPDANSIRNNTPTPGTWNNATLYSEPALLDMAEVKDFFADQSVTLVPGKYSPSSGANTPPPMVDAMCTPPSPNPGGNMMPIPSSGLRVWLAPETLPNQVDSTGVAQWNDMSGNGLNAVAPGAMPLLCNAGNNACVYSSTSLPNGRPVLGFSGSAYLRTPSDSAMNGVTGRSVFVVAMGDDAIAANRYLYAESFSPTPASMSLFHNVTANAYNGQILDMTSVTRTSITTAAAASYWHVHSLLWRAGASSIEAFMDGTSGGASNFSGYNPSGTGHMYTYIGSDNAFTQNWNGNIAEVIVYNRELSASEQTQVECYLRGKFNVNAVNWGHSCP